MSAPAYPYGRNPRVRSAHARSTIMAHAAYPQISSDKILTHSCILIKHSNIYGLNLYFNPGAGQPLPRFCTSRNFRKRYASGQRLGMAGSGRRIARARIVATGNPFASLRGREIDLRRGRVQCLRAMALREIIEASEHDADPVEVGSADIRHNIAQERQG